MPAPLLPLRLQSAPLCRLLAGALWHRQPGVGQQLPWLRSNQRVPGQQGGEEAREAVCLLGFKQMTENQSLRECERVQQSCADPGTAARPSLDTTHACTASVSAIYNTDLLETCGLDLYIGLELHPSDLPEVQSPDRARIDHLQQEQGEV